MISRAIPVLALALALLDASPATAAAQESSAKAYVVGEFTIKDSAAYDRFKSEIGPVVKQYGGRYLVRNGRLGTFEGALPAGPVVVIEFDNFAAASAFERSPENRAVAALRHKASTSRIFIVEGVAP